MSRKIKRVKCRSGLTGYQCSLQDNYPSFEVFGAYCNIYNLHTKLGFSSVRRCWDADPIIQGSTDPSDYCRIINGKRRFYNAE